MAIRITLAVIGMFVGVGIIGLAWNNNLGKAVEVITGNPITSNAGPANQNQNNPPAPPSFIPPIFVPPIFL